MSDYSGLKQNDSLQRFYDKHNSRLPTKPIEYEIGEDMDDKTSIKCKNETPQNRAINAKVAHSKTKGQTHDK